MVKSKSFDSILSGLRERKKFERDIIKKTNNERCSHCNSRIMAIGKSTIAGVCKICTHLALIPDT